MRMSPIVCDKQCTALSCPPCVCASVVRLRDKETPPRWEPSSCTYICGLMAIVSTTASAVMLKDGFENRNEGREPEV